MGIYRGPGGTGDAVNDAASEATLVSQLVTQAQESEANAATSATNAGTSATNASNSATAASTSATNAATSATNAASSASSASSSASSASTSASTATTKASEAATSATNAANSASSASTSASTATTQATNASNSASAAATSATNASNSASAAATSATNAASSATSAAGSASTATTQASNASTSATNAASSATSAAGSATTATTQAGIATTKAGEAATSATNAANSASAASTSATNAANSATTASTQATNASNSATSAASSATAAAASYDSFDDRYLGAKATAPTVDNDGNTLLVGALYFNTTSNFMKVWDGSTWVDAYASLSGALLAANNLSDLASTSTARTNLGLGSIATQAASSVAITGGAIDGTTVGATTPSSGRFTSLSDSGNLTFTGTGNRITGDFSNATVANRVAFQTSTTNGTTNLSIIPNGTDTTSAFHAFNSTDMANASLGTMTVTNAETRFQSTRTGTGTFLPLTMYTGGSERLRIDTSGNVGIGTSSPAGALQIYKPSPVLYVQDSSVGVSVGISANSFVSNAAAINTYNNYPLAFGTNNTERMRIDSSGNVGIGTSSPGSIFEVSSTGPTSFITSTSTTGYAVLGLRNTGASGKSYQLAVGGNAVGANPNSIYIYDVSAAATRFLVDTNGNVGIGTASPGSLLDVAGTIRSTSATPFVELISGSTTMGGLYSPDTTSVNLLARGSKSLVFMSGGVTERMRITSDGNVYIGAASSAGKFSVVGGLSYLQINGAGTQEVLKLDNSDGTAGTQAVKLTFSSSGIAKASITSAVYGNGYMAFATNNDSEKMRIDASGNVGIGVIPTYQLQVQKTSDTVIAVKSTATGTASLYLAGYNSTFTTSDFLLQQDGSGNAYVWNRPSSPMIFATANTERMRITSDGNVGIGTSSPYNTTTDRLTVLKNQNAYAQLVIDNQNSGASAGSSLSLSSYGGGATFVVPSATPGTNPLLINVNGTERMRIDSSGNVLIGTTSQFGTNKVTVQTSGGVVDGLAIYSPSSTNGAILRLADNIYNCAVRSAPSGGSTNLAFDVSGFERMRIDSSGNVGIGKTNPSTPLDVNGTITATNLSLTGQTSIIIGKTATTVDLNAANDAGSFSVRGDATYPAVISFHRTGVFAINMGLNTSNEFVIGGWSASSNAFKLNAGGAGTFLNSCTATQFNGSGAGLTGTASSLSIGGNAATATTANNGAKVWVNFSGVGSATIRGSSGVSSVTYNAGGDYTVNFSTAMPDANYAPVGIAQRDSANICVVSIYGSGTYNMLTTTTARFFTKDNGNSTVPALTVGLAFFR